MTDVMNPSHTAVFSFPMQVDKDAVFRTAMSAIDQLTLWKIYQEYWCEHKPSVTISVNENAWIEGKAWVFVAFEMMRDVSCRRMSEHK